MLVDLRSGNVDLVGAVHRHLDRRVRAALGRSSDRIRSVSVSISDVNGPRGGVDLHCTVGIELLPRGSLRAEATDSDLVSAVGHALARARRAIQRGSGRTRVPVPRGASAPGETDRL